MCSSVNTRLTWLFTDHPPYSSLATLAMSNNTSSNGSPQDTPTKPGTPATTSASPKPPNTPTPDANKPHDIAPAPPPTTAPQAPPPAPSPTSHQPENTSAQSPSPAPTNVNPTPNVSNPKTSPQPQQPSQEDHPNPNSNPNSNPNANPNTPNTEPSNPTQAPGAPGPPDTPEQNSNSPDPVTLITITMSPDSPGQTAIVTVVKTSTRAVTNEFGITTRLVSATVSGNKSPSSTASLQNDPAIAAESNGLSGGGKIAIAVVVPIAAVTVFILAALFIFRRRKQRKHAEELRRKEVEEYGYNPNQDPTIPEISHSSGNQEPPVMREENTGYRGWGNTISPSGRKKSNPGPTAPNICMPAGMTGIGIAYSDEEPATYATLSDTMSDNALLPEHPISENKRDSPGPNLTTNRKNSNTRVSNSSSGSGGNRFEVSHEVTESPFDNNAAISSNDPNNSPILETTSGRAEMAAHPVIRDVVARRNTRIENPNQIPMPPNMGIAQNF